MSKLGTKEYRNVTCALLHQIKLLPDNVPTIVDHVLRRLEKDIGQTLVHDILGLLRFDRNVT